MTPLEIVDFIEAIYKKQKGIYKTLLQKNTLEIDAAIAYLKTLDSEANVLGNYKIFLMLISCFFPKFYMDEHLRAKALLIPRTIINDIVINLNSIRFIYGFIGSESLYNGMIPSDIDPLAEICRDETLETAISVNGSATLDVLKHILVLQDKESPTSLEISLGQALLQMPYSDFLKLFQVARGDKIDEMFLGKNLVFTRETRIDMDIDRLVRPRSFDLNYFSKYFFKNLIEDDWECIQNSDYPMDVFACLRSCAAYSLWSHFEDADSQERFRGLLNDSVNLERLKKLHHGLDYLFGSNNRDLLTKENIETLLAPQNSNFLIYSDTFNLANIPEHLRTQNSFNKILRLSRGKTPTVDVNAYIAEMIRYRALEDSQSTHKKSVHNSVALSLKRLNHLYPLSKWEIQKEVCEFEQFAEEIQTSLFRHLYEEADGENRCDKVAARSIARMIQLSKLWGISTVKESQTGFSLSKIIALIWKATKDKTQHLPNSLNAKENLIRGLAHIQRMYNYGNKQGKDMPSCVGGTINDFVGVLNNIHRSVIIILINEANIATMSISYAQKIFLGRLEKEIKKDKHFMQKIEAEILASDWVYPTLSKLYEECIKATVQKIKTDTFSQMTRAEFKREEIKAINAEMAPWIVKSFAALRENKCMLEHAKRQYNEKYNPQAIANKQEVVKDDFEELLLAIEDAKRAFKRTPAQNKSNLFKKVDLQKIEEFCEILQGKNYSEAIAWLQTGNNHDELKVGIFGRYLKNIFITENSDAKKPFDCPDLNLLDKWIEYSAVDKDYSCYSFAS